MVSPRALCPGCGALTSTTTRSLNGTGSKWQTVIQGHNPLPGNSKGADSRKLCPGSGAPIGEIQEGQITNAAGSAA